MQPGDEIESLISELEQIVNEGKTPFTGGNGKKIVDAQDIYEIIDDIEAKLDERIVNDVAAV